MHSRIRAGDTDREQVIAALSEHFTAGRITVAEFDTRTAAAVAARTIGELAALTSDLPPVSDTRSAGALHLPASAVLRTAMASTLILLVVVAAGVVAMLIPPMGAAMGGMSGMT